MIRIALVASLVLATPIELLPGQALRASASPVESLLVIVRTHAGPPLADAIVALVPDSARSPVRTDAQGHAYLHATSASRPLKVSVRRLGYLPQEITIRVDTVTGPVRIALRTFEGPLSHVCPADYVPTIEITIDTTAMPDSLPVTFVARDGRYIDRQTLTGHARGHAKLAYERRGVYSLSVSARGYRTWRRAGVRIGVANECYLDRRTFHVTLQRTR